jgi:Spy/CpxP family protein refolding chaperone
VISTRGFVIAIAAALALGISGGLVSGILIMRYASPWLMGPPPPRPPFFIPGGDPMAQAGRRVLIEHIQDELELTGEQRERVLEVLDEARETHEAARESVRVRIERELTPEQRARWLELETHYRRMFHDRAGRPRPWGGRR